MQIKIEIEILKQAPNIPLQMHATIHHVHSHTITHTHTQPQRHSTHLVTNLDNTRHKTENSNSTKTYKIIFTFLQHKITHAATTV